MSDRVVIITGGSRGIGRAIALGLGEAGANVVVAARKPESLEEAVAAVQATGAQAIGVSMDDCLSHSELLDKHGLAVRLLSDADGEACNAYGVLQEKEHEGRKKLCILRSTFIIGGDGRIKHALYGVHPRGHAAEVLQLVKGLVKCR